MFLGVPAGMNECVDAWQGQSATWLECRKNSDFDEYCVFIPCANILGGGQKSVARGF